MIGLQEITLFGVLVLGWLVGAIFVGAVASTSGWAAGFGWFLAALLCSPPLAAVLLVASTVQEMDKHLIEAIGRLRESAGGPPTRFQQRFGGAAAEKGDED